MNSILMDFSHTTKYIKTLTNYITGDSINIYYVRRFILNNSDSNHNNINFFIK
jgi:hypothetical protein